MTTEPVQTSGQPGAASTAQATAVVTVNVARNFAGKPSLWVLPGDDSHDHAVIALAIERAIRTKFVRDAKVNYGEAVLFLQDYLRLPEFLAMCRGLEVVLLDRGVEQ